MYFNPEPYFPTIFTGGGFRAARRRGLMIPLQGGDS